MIFLKMVIGFCNSYLQLNDSAYYQAVIIYTKQANDNLVHSPQNMSFKVRYMILPVEQLPSKSGEIVCRLIANHECQVAPCLYLLDIQLLQTMNAVQIRSVELLTRDVLTSLDNEFRFGVWIVNYFSPYFNMLVVKLDGGEIFFDKAAWSSMSWSSVTYTNTYF